MTFDTQTTEFFEVSKLSFQLHSPFSGPHLPSRVHLEKELEVLVRLTLLRP